MYINAMMTTFDSFVLNLWYYRENYGIYGINNNRINKGNLMILQKLWYYTENYETLIYYRKRMRRSTQTIKL